MVHENAGLGVPRDDRLEENRRRKEGAKLRGRPGPLGGDARMDDLRGPRVARRRFGDRLGTGAAAASGGYQESLNRGRFWTALVDAHIRAEEPRQRERLQQRRRQFPQIDDDFGTRRRDQRRLRHRSALRMNTKLEPGRLDGGSQFRLLRQHQRGPVAALQPEPVPDHEGVGLRRSNWQRDQPENRFAGGTLDPLAGDHAAQILPCGKAVADGDDGILLVVAQKQLLLRGLDRR